MKTAELTGAALDWAVAKCEGWRSCDKYPPMLKHYHPDSAHTTRLYVDDLPYSTEWSQGGPIIEREQINLACVTDSLWEAYDNTGMSDEYEQGTTPLEAAMRCYVASKLGDTVDIPKELHP